MSSTQHALLIFGSGPGIGRNVAMLFAERGFRKVLLMSRNKERLAQDADLVRSASAGVDVQEITVDAANTDSVQQALEEANEALGQTPLEFVLFNTARTGPSKFFDFSAEELEADLRISVVSLYTVAKWAMPKLLDLAGSNTDTTPSFVTTSGMLAKDPFPAMFSLATCKGGQYNLVHSLHKEFEPKGVHCPVVVVGGAVKDESVVTNARNIAEETWKVFKQPKHGGKFETLLLDPAYLEHVKNRERRSA